MLLQGFGGNYGEFTHIYVFNVSPIRTSKLKERATIEAELDAEILVPYTADNEYFIRTIMNMYLDAVAMPFWRPTFFADYARPPLKQGLIVILDELSARNMPCITFAVSDAHPWHSRKPLMSLKRDEYVDVAMKEWDPNILIAQRLKEMINAAKNEGLSG